MADEDRAYALSQRILNTPGFFELVDKMLNDEAVTMTLQPRLEFLASVATGKSTEDSILEFFDQLKLSTFPWEHHELKKYRVRTDTYFLQVNILPPSNPNLLKSDVLLVVIDADDFLELQTLRDMIIETELSNQFRDFIVVWDTGGATRSGFSYISLHVLENQLRKLIVSRLMGIEDKDWWDKRIKCLGGISTKSKDNEEKASDITHYSDEILSDIFYTNFSSLERIISNSDNWNDTFEEIFRTKKYIQKLGFLNRLRNKVAHNRFLTERNQNDLYSLFAALSQAFRRVWRS